VVVGSVLAVIGLSLLPVAVQYAAGGVVDDAGAPKYVAIAFTVLAIIVALNVFGRGFIRNVAIFIGILVGIIICGMLGMLDFRGIGDTGLVKVVTPFHFGAPTFYLVPILSMVLVIAITWVESVGDAIVVGDMVGRKPTARNISDLIRADGLSTVIGGAMNSFQYTAFSENVALISITGVRSRWVVALAGVFLIVLGLSPFLAGIAAAIPKAVVGGAGFMMFGTLVVVGIKTLRRVDFDSDFRNFIVIGLSIAMAMVAIVKPEFFSFMPNWSQAVFKSPVIMGAMAAIFLNLVLNGLQAENEGIEKEPE